MKILLLIFIAFNLYANTNITKQFLKDKPRSYAKDFYLSLYLKQKITPNDAIWALGQAKRVNNKLLYPYAKALNHKETSEVIRCIKKPTKFLFNEDADCISLGLSIYKATMIDKSNINKLIKKLEKDYPYLVDKLNIIKSNNPFIALKNSKPSTFFGVFNSAGTKFRSDNFNYNLSSKVIKKLQKYKKSFYLFVKLIVTNDKLNKLQKSLFYIDSSDLSHKTQFLLAINAIKHNKLKIALKYLNQAFNSAYYQFDKNKVLYWQYRLTNNKEILKTLGSSWNNDIYSIFAKEKLNIKIDNIKTLEDTNFKTSSLYDSKNPFAWVNVLDDIKKDFNQSKYIKYTNLFNTKNTLAHKAFLDEKYNKYKYTYLINPYKDIIKNYPIKRQVLINALAKQESRFIATSISSSYAMGVMQIMPFLSKELAKELKEPYNILDQLKANVNIKYANKHLDFLEYRLNHILFVAYAYNGGIGFTKRKILERGLFKKGKYEPYLSMELVQYDESRRYGKKVLANYVLYNNLMNPKNKLSLKQLVNQINNN